MSDELSSRGPSDLASGHAPRSGEVRSAAEPREVLAFELAGEIYAYPLSVVREILRVPPLTQVPRAPATVIGVVSVRGKIVTVVDLRRVLRLELRPASRRARVLLVDHQGEHLGVLVDRVTQVHRLSADEVESSAVVGGGLADYVTGIGRPHGRGAAGSSDDIIILLDPNTILRNS